MHRSEHLSGSEFQCRTGWFSFALGVLSLRRSGESCVTKAARGHPSLYSRDGCTSPMSVADGCLSLRYRLEKDCAGGTKAARPINGGISFSLNVWLLILTTDWLGSLRYCGDFFVFHVIKRSGWRVMNALVLAACWASHGCVWHMCENPVVFPPHCQEPADLA